MCALLRVYTAQNGNSVPTFRDNLHSVFYVLLTVHLSVFVLVVNQLDAKNLFYNEFISCLYMFRGPCAHRQEVKLLLYSLWYYHTYMCDNTRGCIIQF